MTAPGDGLDVILRMHDPARLEELDRAVFSAALSDYRPLTLHVVCQRFGAAGLAAVRARLAPIQAVVPDVAIELHDRAEAEPRDARAALLNLGLAAVRGRLVAFLDYDDVIYPEAYRLLAAELAESGAAIAFAGVLTADVTRAGLVPYTLGKRRVFQGDGLRQLLHDNFCPLHSYMLDRSRLPPGVLAFDEGLGRLEDYDLLLRIVARHPSSFRLKDVILGEYVFKDDGSNINPLATGDGEAAWRATEAVLEARKRVLVVAPAVLAALGVAALGVAGHGLTVAAVLEATR